MMPRMLRWWMIAMLAAPGVVHAQQCCGPITPEGQQLEQFLDGSGVDHLWLAGWHVDWRTGERDRAQPGGAESKTCLLYTSPSPRD